MKEKYELTPKYDSRKSFYGKATVYEDDELGFIRLYSFNHLVVEILRNEPDDFEVTIFRVAKWNSQTTLRHIKDFLKQNGFKADSLSQIENDYKFKEV